MTRILRQCPTMRIPRIFLTIVIVAVLTSASGIAGFEQNSKEIDLDFEDEDLRKPVMAERLDKVDEDVAVSDDEYKPRGLLAALAGFPDDFEEMHPMAKKIVSRSAINSKVQGESKSDSSMTKSVDSLSERSENEKVASPSNSESTDRISSENKNEDHPSKRNTGGQPPPFLGSHRPAGYILWHPVSASASDAPIAANGNHNQFNLAPQDRMNGGHPHQPLFNQQRPIAINNRFQSGDFPFARVSAQPLFMLPPIAANENTEKNYQVENNEKFVKPPKSKANKSKNMNAQKPNQVEQPNNQPGLTVFPNIPPPNRIPSSPFFEFPNGFPRQPFPPPMQQPFGPFPNHQFPPNGPALQQPFQRPPFQLNDLPPQRPFPHDGPQQQPQFHQNGPTPPQPFQHNGPPPRQRPNQDGLSPQQPIQPNGPHRQQSIRDDGPPPPQSFQHNGPPQHFQNSGPPQQFPAQQPFQPNTPPRGPFVSETQNFPLQMLPHPQSNSNSVEGDGRPPPNADQSQQSSTGPQSQPNRPTPHSGPHPAKFHMEHEQRNHQRFRPPFHPHPPFIPHPNFFPPPPPPPPPPFVPMQSNIHPNYPFFPQDKQVPNLNPTATISSQNSIGSGSISASNFAAPHSSPSHGFSTQIPMIHPSPARDFNRTPTTTPSTPPLRTTQNNRETSNQQQQRINNNQFGLPPSKAPFSQVVIGSSLNNYPHVPSTQPSQPEHLRRPEAVFDHTQSHYQIQNVNQVAGQNAPDFRPVEHSYASSTSSSLSLPPPRPSNAPRHYAADTFMDHHVEVQSQADKNYASPGFHNGYRGFPSAVTAAPLITTKKPVRNRGRSPWKVEPSTTKQLSPSQRSDQSYLIASNPSVFEYEVNYPPHQP